MASSLPTNPSLERLSDDARTLQRAVAAREPDALEVVNRHHPRPRIALDREGLALHDAQLTIARSYGFPDWPAMVGYLDVAADLSVDPSAVDESALEPADRFCALAVLHYDDTDAPPRWAAASEILSANPGLVERHVWAAAAANDSSALARHLAGRPSLASTGGGPYGWTPLQYLTYSRVEAARGRDAVLAAAELLLEAGADPTAGYLWCGMSTPFTVLTGVFGEGEQGPRRQPRHPHDIALATLLLDRGAHPVDQQSLYNRMFRADDTHLELLFAHGLADAGPGPWEVTLGAAMETRDQMWRRQVEWAAEHGFVERLRLLAAHGVDTSGATVAPDDLLGDPNGRDDAGATPLHHAAWAGDLDRIGRLLAAGADPSATEPRFGATPAGWARHAYQNEAAELLQAAADARE